VSRYAELTAKVDAFFDRVAQRHPADLACATGCADCCHVRLTITTVEAAAIRAELATWPAPRRAALAAQVALAAQADATQAAQAEAAPDRCVALGPDDRCAIYAARPLVCRSHGVPIRLREGGLPVIQACFRNFTAAGPAAAAPDCVLDQTTLSTVLLAIDQAEGGGARVALAALLAELTA
jgi:Fe-S-cluster containining protein